MTKTKENGHLTPTASYPQPSSGILSYMPRSWVPFAQLMRLDKPGGYYLFAFPHFVGSVHAACLVSLPWAEVLRVNAMLGLGCVFVRGAECTWNDYLDADFDRQVSRTRTRPIARGAVSSRAAYIFTAANATAAAAFLLPLPRMTCVAVIPAIILWFIYPFCKRFTNFPQVPLALVMGWGVIIGECAASRGMEIFAMLAGRSSPNHSVESGASWGLFAVMSLLQLLWDTIYGFQDIKDDVKAGVKNMAFVVKSNPDGFFAAVCVASVLALMMTVMLDSFNAFTGAFTLMAFAAALWWSLRPLNVWKPESCMQCFTQGSVWTTAPIIAGLLVESALRRNNALESEKA